MKRIIVLFGITASFLTPLSAQNTSGDARAGARVIQTNGKSPAKGDYQALKSSHCVYYITSMSGTGSHIPMVIRRWRGQDSALFNSKPGAEYDERGIGLTGALNLAGALYQLDPAISSAVGITHSGGR